MFQLHLTMITPIQSKLKGFIPLRAGGFNISSILFRLLPRWKTLPSIWDSSSRLSLGEVSWLSVKKPQHHGTSCIPDRRMSWAQRTSRHRFSKAWQLHRLRQLLKTLVKDLSKWSKQKTLFYSENTEIKSWSLKEISRNVTLLYKFFKQIASFRANFRES